MRGAIVPVVPPGVGRPGAATCRRPSLRRPAAPATWRTPHRRRAAGRGPLAPGWPASRWRTAALRRVRTRSPNHPASDPVENLRDLDAGEPLVGLGVELQSAEIHAESDEQLARPFLRLGSRRHADRRRRRRARNHRVGKRAGLRDRRHRHARRRFHWLLPRRRVPPHQWGAGTSVSVPCRRSARPATPCRSPASRRPGRPPRRALPPAT